MLLLSYIFFDWNRIGGLLIIYLYLSQFFLIRNFKLLQDRIQKLLDILITQELLKKIEIKKCKMKSSILSQL